jgi:putative tricarboxylic transport membrane protein
MLTRRTALAAAATLPLAARQALAAQLMASLNIFVPAGPGGGWDGLGRAIELICRRIDLVGAFQFENVAGAGGTVGLPRFLQSRRGRPDSLLVAGAIMVGAELANKTPVSLKDTVPVACLTEEAGVIAVPRESEFTTIGQFADALKANPQSVPVAGAAGGSIDHVILCLLLRALGRKPAEANFAAFAGGGPNQAALLGGHVKASVSGWGEFAEQIKAGRIRALATSGTARIDANVPTLVESGYDVVLTNWRGVFGAPGINAPAQAKLAEVMTAMHASAAWKALLAERGWDDAFRTGADFDAFLKRDREATESVLKELGLA